MLNMNNIYHDYREALKEAEAKKQNFDYVQNNLAELDQCNKSVLPQMLEVQHQSYLEEQDQMQEAAYELRQDRMNCNRPINKWESERLMRERKKIAERRAMHFDDSI